MTASPGDRSTDPKARLGALLIDIETACAAIDAGDSSGEAVTHLAAALHAIFQAEQGGPSLLSRLGGTYTRVASGVPKTPHSQACYLPLANVTLDMNPGVPGYFLQATTGPAGLAERPRCHPPLGKASAFRQIQAPDWWKSEPVVVVDHSKATRRDLVAWAGADASRPVTLPPVRLPLNYGVQLEVPLPEILRASLRQVAHEVLGSPDLRKLAGR